MDDRRPGNVWRLRDGREIYLLRPAQLDALPPGTELISISGRTLVLGRDPIDTDSRGGWLACGPLYVAGVTEALVGRERVTALDPATTYRARIHVTGPAGQRALELLREGGWSPITGDPATVEIRSRPASISRALSQPGIALALGHGAVLTVMTRGAWRPASLFSDGLAVTEIVHDGSGPSL